MLKHLVWRNTKKRGIPRKKGKLKASEQVWMAWVPPVAQDAFTAEPARNFDRNCQLNPLECLRKYSARTFAFAGSHRDGGFQL